MALTKFEKNMDIIAALDDEPNDVGGLSAAELKAKFDEGGKALQDYINNTLLPALDNAGVERSVLLPENAGGFKYMRLNSDKVLEVSTDGETWQATGSSGHLIYDKNGVQLPQRSRLKFANSEVTDDGTYTIVQEETANKAFPCNPNLLENWYFGNPVNQRGQAEYTSSGSGNTYCIDRWAVQFEGTKYTVATATLSNISGANVGQMNRLMPNNEAAPFVGRQMTLSLLVDNSDGVNVSVSVRDRTRWSHLLPSKTGSGNLITTTGVFGILNGGEDIQISFVVPQGKSVNLIAAKLELGSQQTLAHQENGVWVLNEIPKFGEQLEACQRYYQVYTTAAARPAKALDCRPVMRTDPVQSTVNVDGVTLYANSAEL